VVGDVKRPALADQATAGRAESWQGFELTAVQGTGAFKVCPGIRQPPIRGVG